MNSNNIHFSLQIVPKSKTIPTYDLVDKAIDVIKSSGLRYLVTPMDTVMEGPFEKVNQVALDAQEAVMNAGAEEVLVFIKMHYRKDGEVTFEEKGISN